jgi:hypothetical protein
LLFIAGTPIQALVAESLLLPPVGVEHMPEVSGPDDPGKIEPEQARSSPPSIMERELFESLVHHLIEKGVLTKNDALSIVQTVAVVTRGRLGSSDAGREAIQNDLGVLRRLYESFELLDNEPVAREASEGGNVVQLRPPLHGDQPEFPED